MASSWTEKMPTVTLGVFIEQATPFLEEFLAKVAGLIYPKDKIDLFIHNAVTLREPSFTEFPLVLITNCNFGDDFISIEVFLSNGWHWIDSGAVPQVAGGVVFGAPPRRIRQRQVHRQRRQCQRVARQGPRNVSREPLLRFFPSLSFLVAFSMT